MMRVSDAMAHRNDGGYRHVVSVSGGKDSAALALYLFDKHPEVRVEYVFCDTGCELPETYQYLGRLEAILGQPIIYLNALDLIGVAKRPGRNPFDIWLNEVYGGFLPSPRARWCTRVLKIKPFEHYIGEDKAFSYIGIRGDEDREGYKPKKPARHLGATQHHPGVSIQGRRTRVARHQDDLGRIGPRLAQLLRMAIPFWMLLLLLPADR